MTSDQISKAQVMPILKSEAECVAAVWLSEIAYQLAVMNEREAAKKPQSVEQYLGMSKPK